MVLLLCIFHLLQALWRWEWTSGNRIDKLKTNIKPWKKTCSRMQQFLHVQNDILPWKAEWAVSEWIERNLSTHNTNTTNYVEVSFPLTKDNQFSCVRAYNLLDLLDIGLDDSVYYATQCLVISNNRISQLKNQISRYVAKKCKIDGKKIVTLDDNSYLVPSERIEGKMYVVNMDLRLWPMV